MIGFYNYTVLLTYISLICSVVGITFAMSGRPLHALICLLVSGICDMFDGIIARTKTDRTESEKKFGIEIDSLSDLVCFGVLPAVIGFSLGLHEWFWRVIMVLYVLAALIRLAYFDVTEEQRQKVESGCRKYYEGLPVTVTSVLFPFFYLFRGLIGHTFPHIYGCLLGVIALCFVMRIKIFKPGHKFVFVSAVFGLLIIAALITMKCFHLIK